jgi:hypothetical protein
MIVFIYLNLIVVILTVNKGRAIAQAVSLPLNPERLHVKFMVH